jgi:hypothetical protein
MSLFLLVGRKLSVTVKRSITNVASNRLVCKALKILNEMGRFSEAKKLSLKRDEAESTFCLLINHG